MPDRFLTIKEAAAFTGKAEITVRRLVHEIVKEDRQDKKTPSRERGLIKPSGSEIAEFKHRGHPYTYTISEKLLRARFQGNDQATDGDQSRGREDAETRKNEMDALMKEQLGQKQEQLTVKDGQIESLTKLVHNLGDQLNERLRESNVLMKGLQDRMALPQGTTAPPALVEVSQGKPPKTKKQGSAQTTKHPSPKTKKQPAKRPKQQPVRGFVRDLLGLR